ncbi:hypothetical protein, partial [[Clostridium] innocuum]|uniref:hypothetical protein n=1 Tax=Clostridium innocuum TaxID=1522 RepID=UPI003A4E5AAC
NGHNWNELTDGEKRGFVEQSFQETFEVDEYIPLLLHKRHILHYLFLVQYSLVVHTDRIMNNRHFRYKRIHIQE